MEYLKEQTNSEITPENITLRVYEAGGAGSYL